MNERGNDDIFEDVCRVITGNSVLSDLRCHRDEVKRFLDIMPLDQYPEEQVERFRKYVFNDTEEIRKELEERKRMLKKLMLDFGIDDR